jgi:glycosyltransferase involved in cell wall biosynthesis
MHCASRRLSVTTQPTSLTISVLLATYRRRALLPRVLAPLLADPAASEVVVVVDGCRDGSLEYLQQIALAHPQLKPVFVANGGASRALLTGARVATGDVLVILDDDEILELDSLAGHLRHHAEQDETVVVGHVEMDMPGVRRRGDFSRHTYSRAYDADCARWSADPSTILRNLWGGYMSVRRRDYLRVMEGPWQFIDGYHFDLDFGARCVAVGYHGRFDPSLRVLHLYERDRLGFMRDAYSSGQNRIRVHSAHASVLGSLDPSFVDHGMSGWAVAIVNLALRHWLIYHLVTLGLTIAGLLGLWDLETRASFLLWAIEQKRGAMDAMSEMQSAARVDESATAIDSATMVDEVAR